MADAAGKKNSIIGRLIAVFTVICIIGAVAAYSYFSNKVYFSSGDKPGNTAGNLYNGGLFCEKDGVIYFSNPNDQYTLYSMDTGLSNFKKLYNDYARYINADENYVYYTRKNNKKEGGSQSIFIFFSTGVYRLKKNGGGLTVITQEPTGSLLLLNNKLYYQIYNNNSLELHRVGIDKERDIKVATGDAPVVSAKDGIIYYGGLLENHDIYTIGSSGNVSKLFEADAYLPIATDTGIFYINTADDYRLHLIDYEGENDSLIIDDSMTWYNVTDDGKLIFYQHDAKKDSALFMFNTETGSSTKILEGNYKWISLAGGYCFFYDFSEEKVYAYNYGSGSLSLFNPPVKN